MRGGRFSNPCGFAAPLNVPARRLTIFAKPARTGYGGAAPGVSILLSPSNESAQGFRFRPAVLLSRAETAFGRAFTTVADAAVTHRELTFAVVMTLLFYLPSLRNSSNDAGFLYTGDILGFYWPALVKLHSLLSSFHFTALDFSSYNASADFFLTPNFFGVHPVFVIYSLLSAGWRTTITDIGHLLVVALALHSLVSCYFTSRLLIRFFGLNFWLASFAAAAFTFSIFTVTAHGEPMFVFCTSVIPWAVYGALAYQQNPTFRRLVLGAPAPLLMYLGGYMPMGVASLLLAALITAGTIFFLDPPEPLATRAERLMRAAMTFLFATLIASPYLVSVYLFMQESPSGTTGSIFYSAHQMSELPHSLLRVLSLYWFVPGPSHEFSPHWGLTAVTIATLFFLSPTASNRLTQLEWNLLKICGFLYAATFLSIFGNFSVVSDLVYYYVPQVGKMHLYQRFLMPANLLVAIMIAIMLRPLVEDAPPIATRLAVVLLGAGTVAAAYILGREPALATQIGFSNYVVMELCLALLFAITLLAPGVTFKYVAAIILFALPTLDRMYDYSVYGHTLVEQQKRMPIALNPAERAKLVAFLDRYKTKTLIKYVDITPMWNAAGIEPFPKSFPYFVLKELNLSSYGGFDFYLATRADYMAKMPIGANVAVKPNWDFVTRTGADFLVAQESDLNTGELNGIIEPPAGGNVYRLANGTVIVPLLSRAQRNLSSPPIFDNGYVRISEPLPSSEAAQPKNLALRKPARQSKTIGDAEASRAVDGNADGNFLAGSVSHTAADRNAWFEIDLGGVEQIDQIKLWNRTDCCGFRLANYWVLVSEEPFPDDATADELRARPGTWSKLNTTSAPEATVSTGGVPGRYVRIALSGQGALEESFLSIAEVEVLQVDPASQPKPYKIKPKVIDFTSNNANYLRLEVDAAEPAKVEYLLWNNPRLSYYVNGRHVIPGKIEGLTAIDIGAGRSTVEIVYRHWPLTLFWMFYAAYAALLVWLGIVALRRARQHRLARGERMS